MLFTFLSFKFLSTLSLRRATYGALKHVHEEEISIHALLAESDDTGVHHIGHHHDFYPRSPCGERPRRVLKCDNRAIISIHALLAESDAPQQENGQAATISIHALLAESDFGPISAGFTGGLFLSTLSLRRATAAFCQAVSAKLYFYPRSPCGERRTTIITICTALKFLSTLSLRRATCD